VPTVVYVSTAARRYHVQNTGAKVLDTDVKSVGVSLYPVALDALLEQFGDPLPLGTCTPLTVDEEYGVGCPLGRFGSTHR